MANEGRSLVELEVRQLAPTKSPPQPPLPEGWRWAKDKEIDATAGAFAVHELTRLPIGEFENSVDSKGRPIAAFCCYHWDDHTTGRTGRYVWHKGISILVPK